MSERQASSANRPLANVRADSMETKSPMDVLRVNLNISTAQIVEIIREGQEREYE